MRWITPFKSRNRKIWVQLCCFWFCCRYIIDFYVFPHLALLFEAASWWHHQIETFSALLAMCAGNSPVTGEFPAQRPVTRSFDVFFDRRLNKRLSKQWWGWWFETPSRPLWLHSNVRWYWGKIGTKSQQKSAQCEYYAWLLGHSIDSVITSISLQVDTWNCSVIKQIVIVGGINYARSVDYT